MSLLARCVNPADMCYSEWMHVWYSLQLLYFMPIRYYTYHQRGYHYVGLLIRRPSLLEC